VSDSATITNLTTINWSQPNLNASTVVTDTLVVTNTSAVNLDVSGVMNVSDLNISDLNVSDISVSTLSVGDIVIDEAEVTTLRFDDVSNANYSEIQRDNDTLTIAGGYLNAQGTQFNGDIAFTPYNLTNATPPSMVVQASDGKVYIPNMSALDINTSNITATNIVNTNQITATGVGIFKSSLAVMNPISQTQTFFWAGTAFQLGNLASVDFNIGNDGSNPNKGIIVRGGVNSSVEIPILTADNLSSTLANISTLNVSTINIADISVPDINTSQLNASNISVDVDLRVFGTTQTDVLEADIMSAGCDMTSTLETSTNMYYPNNLLIDYSAPQIATTIELSSNLSLNDIELLPDLVTAADPTFSMLSGTAQITNANISTLTCDQANTSQINASNISIDADLSVTGTATITDADITTLTCDLTPNLTAGTGITITSVGGKPTISSSTAITDPLNLSTLNASQVNASNISIDENLSVAGYAYVRWDMNVSNTLYTTANVDAGNSIFANANMVAGGNVTSTGYNFKRTVADGGLTMANIFANANSLDMAMSYDWNIYKSNNTGVRMMQFDFSTGNVNMSNASINNLSVISTITTPDATITDLVIPGTVSIPGILNHDFSKNVTAGAGINITHVGNQMTIAATASGVTDPLNLSTLNASQANASNISVGTIQPGLINASVTNTEFLNVSGSAAQLVDGLTVFGQTALQNTSITNLSLTTLTCDLTPNLTAGTGITITSVGGKPTITATGGSVADPLNLSKLNASNISVDSDITVERVEAGTTNGGGLFAKNGRGVFSTGGFYLNNAADGTGGNLNIFWDSGTSQYQMGNLDGDDVRVSNAYLTGGLVVDGTTSEVNMSDCNISQLNASNISVNAGITTATLAATGNILTEDSFTFRTDAFTAFTITNNTNPNEYRLSTTASNQDIRICNATGAGGLLFDAGNNDINISQLNASNIDVDANITTNTLTCDLTPNLTAGTGITITSVGGKPTITATGGGGVTDPLNISQLNASNISVDVDVTIARDLNVQRYLDSGRPRFMMLARTNDLALTGAGERGATFNTNSTGQVAGEFGVANGGEIQVTTGGWYRLSWAIGFVLVSSGNRYSFRTYNMTRTNAGGWTYVQLKDRLGSVGYCRSSSLNQETVSNGSVLRYIPANGWARVNIGAMVQGSTNFSSSFTGTNLRGSSNFMVEFISSASET